MIRQLVCSVNIYCTFGNFSKSVATNILPNLSTFFSIFCKGVKIFKLSGEIIFGQLIKTFGDFLLVTLLVPNGESLFKNLINFCSRNIC